MNAADAEVIDGMVREAKTYQRFLGGYRVLAVSGSEEAPAAVMVETIGHNDRSMIDRLFVRSTSSGERINSVDLDVGDGTPEFPGYGVNSWQPEQSGQLVYATAFSRALHSVNPAR